MYKSQPLCNILENCRTRPPKLQDRTLATYHYNKMKQSTRPLSEVRTPQVSPALPLARSPQNHSELSVSVSCRLPMLAGSSASSEGDSASSGSTKSLLRLGLRCCRIRCSRRRRVAPPARPPGALVVVAGGSVVVPGATVVAAGGLALVPGAIVGSAGGIAVVPDAIVVATVPGAIVAAAACSAPVANALVVAAGGWCLGPAASRPRRSIARRPRRCCRLHRTGGRCPRYRRR